MPYKVLTDSFLVKDDPLRHFPYIAENDFFYDFCRYEMRKTICLPVSDVMTAIEVV